MSRSMKLDSAESFRVIVTQQTQLPGFFKIEVFGPFSNIGTAKSTARRECMTVGGAPKPGRSARIQRATTEWEYVA